tara:strand:+ start:73 stop:372 length:300 start_codon:yes stop_codon:yes gene_type:complete
MQQKKIKKSKKSKLDSYLQKERNMTSNASSSQAYNPRKEAVKKIVGMSAGVGAFTKGAVRGSNKQTATNMLMGAGMGALMALPDIVRIKRKKKKAKKKK